MTDRTYIKELLDRYMHDEGTAKETAILMQLITEQKDPQLWNELVAEIMTERESVVVVDRETWQPVLVELLQKAKVRAAAQQEPVRSHGQPLRPATSHLFWRWAAAAAVLLLLAGTYFWQRYNSARQVIVPPVTDVAPGTHKAILTLADGSQVTLDSATHQVIRQDEATVRQQGGSLQYEPLATGGRTSFNTLATPRGGQFQIRLPDGTQVWLNASTSLRYPIAFTGTQRIVEVSGEAYFEVAPNARQPFRVRTGTGAFIDVLGTSFNVNAYTDEATIRATLVTGKISIVQNKDTALLSPGQQAQIGPQSHISVEKSADLYKALAWKHGLFNFNDEKLPSVMRQIARWYNIEVVYEKGVPDVEFVGEMNRNVPLSILLQGLQGLDVHFRVDGRRLIVTP